MRRYRRLLTAAAVLVALGVGGCADDPTEPPVCESLAAAQVTVDHIRETNDSENGLSQLRPYLAQLRTDLQQLYADAKTQYAPQAEALRTSVDELSTRVDTAKADPNTENIAAVRSAVGGVRESARQLRDALAGTC
ncbi:hypothetical protein [Cryptosporangium minutisporangium]|uniref:Secreted protein n=1 Tax=Cryptosporangium minutisporangium TaxID=113569 RepID=A0ABP6T0B0_9ACTN